MGPGRLVLPRPSDRRAAPREDHVLHRRHRRDVLQLSASGKVTVLCGGFGAARFLAGLRNRPRLEVTCVVNTSDDLEYAGLHVCPDVDTVCYGLAGCYDEERGWGVVGDTFTNQEALRRYGAGWFGVGDADLATHLRRTALLRAGATLSEATADLARSLGLSACVLPMSDAPVRTMVVSDDARLGFQEYLVRRRAEPAVRAVEYEGASAADPAPGVLAAIEEADAVVVAPSSPVASIGPILALPGVRAALAARPGPVVAVTPVVSGRPPGTGPERSRAHVRSAFLAAQGFEHRAAAVAAGYADFADGFVLDGRDGTERAEIEGHGVAVLVADTLAPAGEERVALAEAVLGFARSL